MITLKWPTLVGLALLLLLSGSFLNRLPFNDSSRHLPSDSQKTPSPLYWVAPMDPEYRRQAPGKSPMGMDLIPVYRKPEDTAGSVFISPAMVNNLGVKTEKVRYSNIEEIIEIPGYIRFNRQYLQQINPRNAGWITKLHVSTKGNKVAKGQPLYDLYAPELVHAQAEYLLALESGNRQQIKASEAHLLALDVPSAQIRQLKRTGKIQQQVTFQASENGVITHLAAKEGDYITPDTLLMETASLEHLWVEAAVTESEFSGLEEGMQATITHQPLPGKSWQAAINTLHPEIDPVSRTLGILLAIRSVDRQLRPNMLVNVAIRKPVRERVLTVPEAALIRTSKENRVVLALGDGQFRSIRVTPGKISHGRAEILEGLSERDEVVISAQFLIDAESSKTAAFRRMENNHRHNKGHEGDHTHD